MGEKVEIDVGKFDKAIHVVKQLVHEEALRMNNKKDFPDNHFEGNLQWAVQLLYDCLED